MYLKEQVYTIQTTLAMNTQINLINETNPLQSN